MNRMTTPAPDGHVTAADLTAALDRLGVFETMVEELLAEQAALTAELSALREQGQTKSYHFREKMAQKLNNNAVIDRLEQYHLL